jgi:hypothetical protein
MSLLLWGLLILSDPYNGSTIDREQSFNLYQTAYNSLFSGLKCYPVGKAGEMQIAEHGKLEARLESVRKKLSAYFGEETVSIQQIKLDNIIQDEVETVNFPTCKHYKSKLSEAKRAIRKLNKMFKTSH